MMKVLCVIPSRISSTRLPRKPLANIAGTPMIAWVHAAAVACPNIDKTLVATDSEEIARVITHVGGEVVMTDPNIQTGSDRVAAVSAQYPEYDVVLNLQGDEPFMKPEMLSTLIHPFTVHSDLKMATLCYPLDFEKFYHSPDIVKVILNQKSQALYFSRSPIPYQRASVQNLPVYHHIGLYAYQRDFLASYTKLPQTPLEQSEKLEQLRAMEHGYVIHVEKIQEKTLDVNTPEELEAAQKKALAENLRPVQ